MANIYSNLYTRPADAPAGAVSYKGPTPERSQSAVTAVAVITGAVASGDILFLRRMAPGEILLGMDMTHSGDSNITAATLVLKPTDGGSNINVSAAGALLDGAVNTVLAFTGVLAPVVPDDGKEYDLCWVAGAAGGNVTHTHVIRSAQPGN